MLNNVDFSVSHGSQELKLLENKVCNVMTILKRQHESLILEGQCEGGPRGRASLNELVPKSTPKTVSKWEPESMENHGK